MVDASEGLKLSECVRCGLCLQHCPTYLETGLETESPRGRLYLMRALANGEIEATRGAVGHLDMCLQCRNCEAVCPSGVPYGRLMERARHEVLESPRAPTAWKLRSLVLREIVARPERLGPLLSAVRLAQSAGFRSAVERLPFLGPRVSLAPWIGGRAFTETGMVGRPAGAAARRVAILTGCIMPFAYGRVHRATIKALTINGCEVVAPAAQVCCGALHAHNGDLDTAQALARRNVDAFAAAGADAIVVNSAGCGAAVKEYGELLAGDALYAEKAARLSATVSDVSEFLVSLPLRPPGGALDLAVTYQDSCHLAHAQRISDAPRHVLQAIPRIRLVEMKRPDRCCGSAGVYGWTQSEMSLALLDRKLDDIAGTGSEVIATSNPGCMAQIDAGLRRRRVRGQTVHVIELLARAYAGS